MSVKEIEDYFNEENEITKMEKLKTKLKKILDNQLINVDISIKEKSYGSDSNIYKIKNLIDNCLSLSKEKSKNNYKLEVISKGDYFLIHIKDNMFKIDKSDIIHIAILKNEIRLNDNQLVIELKNKSTEIKIDLDDMECFAVYEKYHVSLKYSYKKEKILEFLFSELHEYIERKNSAIYL